MHIFLAYADNDPHAQEAIDALCQAGHIVATKHFPHDFAWYAVGVAVGGDTVVNYLTHMAQQAVDQASQNLLADLNACDACLVIDSPQPDAFAYMVLGIFLSANRRTAIWFPQEPVIPNLLHVPVPVKSNTLRSILDWFGSGIPRAAYQMAAMELEERARATS